jgi:small subunit ribosomal protein S18
MRDRDRDRDTGPESAVRTGEGGRKIYTKFRKENRCRFCRDGIDEIDYKDLNSLMKLTSSQGKIFSRRRSGNCAGHQRSAKRAIKYARFLALIPYVGTGAL